MPVPLQRQVNQGEPGLSKSNGKSRFRYRKVVAIDDSVLQTRQRDLRSVGLMIYRRFNKRSQRPILVPFTIDTLAFFNTRRALQELKNRILRRLT